MFRFLNKFLKTSPGRSKPAKRVRLEVESLEERSLPTVGIMHSGVAISIYATTKGDTVQISRQDNNTPDNLYDDTVTVKWTRGDTGQVSIQQFNTWVYQNIGDKLVLVPNVTDLYFFGGAGGDKVWNNTNLPSKLFGMGGNDELHGGSVADQIQGGLGSDKIYGGDGPDNLMGNGPSQGGSDPTATDYVYGDKGADILEGGFKQTSFLFGGADGDKLTGGATATNLLYGEGGNDVLRGGGQGAVNFLYGQEGNDWMIGGSSKFGQPKTFNQMIDDDGNDTFMGGNRAFNFMNAVDGGVPGQEDVIVPGVINSLDSIFADANDTVWDFANGAYPKSPPF